MAGESGNYNQVIQYRRDRLMKTATWRKNRWESGQYCVMAMGTSNVPVSVRARDNVMSHILVGGGKRLDFTF